MLCYQYTLRDKMYPIFLVAGAVKISVLQWYARHIRYHIWARPIQCLVEEKQNGQFINLVFLSRSPQPSTSSLQRAFSSCSYSEGRHTTEMVPYPKRILLSIHVYCFLIICQQLYSISWIASVVQNGIGTSPDSHKETRL